MANNSNKFIIKYRHNYYDISDFLHKHPGGFNTLKGLKNADITAHFRKDPPHSDAAMYLMQEYKIPVSEFHCQKKVNERIKKQLKENVQVIENLDFDSNNHSDKRETCNTGVDESMEHIVNWSKPMLNQIRTITQHYDEWVHKPVDRPLRLLGPWYLEMCTKTPWWLVPTFWIPIISKLIYSELKNGQISKNTSKSMLFIFCFIIGVLLWTFLEYILHRFIFHMKVHATTHPWLCILHFTIHGLHHKVPFDQMRLVFPPLAAALIASILYAPLALCLPQPRLILAGALFGYLCYDLMHYYLHYGSPINRHLYHMKRYHYQHHFSHQDIGYGISSPLWDFVFNTRIHLKSLRFHLKWK